MELSLKMKALSEGLVKLSKKSIKRLRDKERTMDRDNWRGVSTWPKGRSHR